MQRFVLLEPKDPVAYPQHPMRPANARRPVYVVQEKPKGESEPRETVR